MADTKTSAFTALAGASLARGDLFGTVDISDTTMAASGTNKKLTFDELAGAISPFACCGRLTTESGVGVSTSDRTSQGTIYFTPWNGDRVALYDGTSWDFHTFTERSLALSSLTSGKNYDVFLYDNSGTLTLELSAAWTNDTTRADALTLQNGIYVKSGSTTRRYLGTIRTTGTTTTEDSLAKRFLWNLYNQVPRRMRVAEASLHSYNGGYRQWRAQSANQFEFVCGLASVVRARMAWEATPGAAGRYAIGSIGVDTTSVLGDGFAYVQSAVDNPGQGLSCSSVSSVSAGYHYVVPLQSTVSSGSSDFANFNLSGEILG